jgi:hypothetical protein
MSNPSDHTTITNEKSPVVEPKVKQGFFSRNRPGTAGSVATSTAGNTDTDEKLPHPDTPEPKAKRGFFSRSRPGTAGSTAKSTGGNTEKDEKHPHPDALVVPDGESKAEPVPDVPASLKDMFR